MKSITKILFSLLTVGVVAGAAFYGTTAFFSDTETSEGNTFTAGEIDLKVSSHSWSASTANLPVGYEPIPAQDWNGQEAMFNFVDLKPGDMGGGYFDLNIQTNPAYACFASEITATAENGRNEPELDAEDDTDLVGELQDYLNIVYFEDNNNDGKWNAGDGAVSEPVLLNTVTSTGWLSLKDSVTGLFNTVIEPGTPKNLGYMWCFGTFNDALTECNGTGDHNIAQT